MTAADASQPPSERAAAHNATPRHTSTDRTEAPADKRKKHATPRLGTPHAVQLYFYIYETHLFMKYLPFADEH